MPNVPRNAFEAVGRVAAALANGEQVAVSADVRTRRKLVCAFCPANVGGRCRDCGCFVVAKAMLATETCPRGKWR